MKSIGVMICCFMSFALVAQDLNNERIRKIAARKKSIYLDRGIFHSGNRSGSSGVKAVRHNYNKRLGYERLVIDFTTPIPPKVYGYFASDTKKLHLDLFKTNVKGAVGSFGNSRFVKNLDFFQFAENTLSTEISFKRKVNIDVFYLEKPGRLVVDIKE